MLLLSKLLARQDRGCAFQVLLLLPLFFVAGTTSAQPQSATDPAQTTAVQVTPLAAVVHAGIPHATDADLPDAPRPASEMGDASTGESSSFDENPESPESIGDPMGFGVSPAVSTRVPLNQCPYDQTGARECRVHWHQLIISSSVFNAFQNGGNLYTSYWYRYETTTGKWFQRWFDSDLGWRWGQWHDGNPFVDDYVGHGIMGSITNYLWIQNDPKGMTLEFGNNKQYWKSRLRAMAFSTAYSFEWKFGPFGEAGVGHNGDHPTDSVNGVKQNDTGDVELVTTPVVGLGWTIAEDLLDKHVVRKFEEKPHGPFALLAISLFTPSRATANILRWRPPWYRDDRPVKAYSFFSEPPGPEDEVASLEPASAGGPPSTSDGAGAGVTQRAHNREVLPEWPHYGGVHEFGAWWGMSLMSGHIWGYAKDIKYMPLAVQYSYLLYPGGKWNLRYSPEVTIPAMLDEPKTGVKVISKYDQHLRSRTYGGGVSPAGLRASFFPESRVQPFLSSNGGFVYFGQRVLSPQGSQFMYTIDFGTGLTFYRKRRQSVSIGYRYQHLSNANISLHNPGTDTNVFYVHVSRFRTKGYR